MGKLPKEVKKELKKARKTNNIVLNKRDLSEIPQETFELLKLESLIASENRIISLPNEIGLLVQLKVTQPSSA